MIVISDTSSISNLLMIGKLSILKDVFGKIIIPQAVLEELLVLERFGHDLTEIHESSWIEVSEPSDVDFVQTLRENLDLGESAAIALAIELGASNLVIDEKKGRRIAAELGLEIIGLVGILLEARERGIINSAKSTLDELMEKANFRISQAFYQKILSKLNEG